MFSVGREIPGGEFAPNKTHECN